MTHNRHDIEDMHIGQYGTLDVNVEDEDGNPQDMTGGSAKLYAIPLSERHLAEGDASIQFEKTIGDGIEVVDAQAGELRVTFDPVDTEDLRPENYWYRMNIENNEGDPVPGAVAGKLDLSYD